MGIINNARHVTHPKTYVWSDISITLTIRILIALKICGPSSRAAKRSSDSTVINTCITCFRELRDTERASGALENTPNMVSVRQLMSLSTVASGCWPDSMLGMCVVKIMFSWRETAFRNWSMCLLTSLWFLFLTTFSNCTKAWVLAVTSPLAIWEMT